MHNAVRKGYGTRKSVPAARRCLARYLTGCRAAAALEAALAISLLVLAFVSTMEIVNAMRQMNVTERAAWAIARANAVEAGPAAGADALDQRIQAALAREFDVDFVPTHFTFDVTAYDTPTAMAGDTPSAQPGARLGGAPGALVVVRAQYASPDAGRLRPLLGVTSFQAVALAVNEPALGP